MSGCGGSMRMRGRDSCRGGETLRRIVYALAAGCAAAVGAVSPPDHSSASAPAPGRRFVICDDSSSMVLHTSAEGLLSLAAGGNRIAFRRFVGEILLMPDSVDGSRLATTIVADSLEVLDDATEERRETILSTMRQQVMETSLYPTIVFRSAWATERVGAGRSTVMRSELTLHGVTRQIDIPVAVTRDGNAVRIAGEFGLLHSDYGMTPAQFVGGLVGVKDEMLFRFDVRAWRQ